MVSERRKNLPIVSKKSMKNRKDLLVAQILCN